MKVSVKESVVSKTSGVLSAFYAILVDGIAAVLLWELAC